jgi:hypothetical protein
MFIIETFQTYRDSPIPMLETKSEKLMPYLSQYYNQAYKYLISWRLRMFLLLFNKTIFQRLVLKHFSCVKQRTKRSAQCTIYNSSHSLFLYIQFFQFPFPFLHLLINPKKHYNFFLLSPNQTFHNISKGWKK